MPKYDVEQVTRALQLVKDGTPHNEIVERCGMGLSTLTRHITAYRAGERPDIDVGVLPAPRSTPRNGKRGGTASLVRLRTHHSATTHAERIAADAAGMLEEAGRLEEAASKLREDAARLQEAAKVLAGT